MELKPINRICPHCRNGNYMRIISGKNVGKLNVKCINCNSYYNYDELLKRNNSKPLNGADGRTMNDLISRAAILEALGHFNDYVNGDEHFLNGIETAKEIAENLPAVDAAPVVHARWIDECCSKCGTYVYHGCADNYCPHCGAKMMEVEHGNRNHS